MTILVLASQSAVRRQVLTNAGLCFEVEAADVDETAIKQKLTATGAEAGEIAAALAAEKARTISGRRSGDLVIGADQILACGADLFDKPEGIAGARQHLQRLRGQTHQLHSAVCLARAGEVLWQHLEVPRLTMRDFSDAELEAYLAHSGDGILSSVGAYRLEDIGVQLFADIAGDYFSILGLPLLPLLAVLRQHGFPEIAG
jgi:septum formation protein